MNKRVHKGKISLILWLILFTHVQAEQLHFSKQEMGDTYQFNYKWIDNLHNEQKMSFTLDKTALFDRFRHFRTYKENLAKKAVSQAISKEIRNNPLDGVQVIFPKKNKGDNIIIKGHESKKIQQARQTITALEQQFFTEYLTENYYHQFMTHENILGIKPDHVSIANASVDDLKVIKPLILEKVSIQNIREATDFVLSFVQSIPYSTLESRLSSSGAGFNTPLKLLWENQGDCDSKVTLTAAILRALMPRVEMILVYIDQHAFIGIAVASEADEISITEGNITYVLAEPTGPALLSLGTLSITSEQAIYNGHYTTELYH